MIDLFPMFCYRMCNNEKIMPKMHGWYLISYAEAFTEARLMKEKGASASQVYTV